MRKVLYFAVPFAFFIACEDAADECTTCYNVKKETSSGSIVERKSEGVKCGSDIDSLLAIKPISMGSDYTLYYECE
jgi:hypothetical protein